MLLTCLFSFESFVSKSILGTLEIKASLERQRLRLFWANVSYNRHVLASSSYTFQQCIRNVVSSLMVFRTVYL